MPLPPFRPVHPADSERPISASSEALTKDWIVRVIEHTPLDAIRDLPTDRIARDLPPLVEEILRAVTTPGVEPDLTPGGQLHQRAQAVAALRDDGNGSSSHVPHDIAALEGVLLSTLKRELPEDPWRLADAVDRVARLFSSLQAVMLEDLLRNRSTELEWLANTDGLTGLFNLRYLQQQMDYLLGLQHRYGHPFSLLILDVDGLKRVNDSYGHAAGDQLLVGVAECIRAATRTVDVPARIGGDEFCVLTPHQTAARAAILGDRLAASVEALATSEGARVGVSIGIVCCPEHSHDPERLLELADGAMYRAKASGQRVATADVEPAVIDVDEHP